MEGRRSARSATLDQVAPRTDLQEEGGHGEERSLPQSQARDEGWLLLGALTGEPTGQRCGGLGRL